MRAGTYSIVARDRDSGELGVAVQSHWFSVGSVVSWAQPGVGAVATQSVAEVAHGPNTLAQISDAGDAHGAIAAVLAADSLARVRQVGAVDASGRAGAHTGEGCIPFADDVQGDGFSCQANMMAATTVPAAMAAAYEAAEGDLAARLLAALDAAEAEGGDVRGRQSAALLVVPPRGEAWRTRFDVRVEDHREPLPELHRLVRLARAYELAERADDALARGARAEATRLYLGATELAPEADELIFWAGLGVAGDDLGRGAELVRRAAGVKQSWLTLLERLPDELEPNAAAVRDALREPSSG
ncbi:MAG TPA: DUF1028 domain-containing protein [Solirubrobacteraceae bacterium]|nr:DUF1028 domain-containing protein [Solirubrobacteraceae bacterium]